MSWTKTSDDFSDDCWTLSDRAYRLHHEALTWSNRKLLDCRIPKEDVRRFARNGDDGVKELLAAEFWGEDDEAYIIFHHAGYQRSRAEVLKRQATSAANGRRGGRPPKPPREIVGVTGNPVGSEVGSPVADPADNPGGQDRTGQEREAVEEQDLNEQPEPPTLSLVQASSDNEPPWHPDDPDYANAGPAAWR